MPQAPLQPSLVTRDLSRLLRPRSVAVLGGVWADTVADQCRKLGFDGVLYRVNPKRAAAGDTDCFATLSDLPDVPDAVFCGVNREATVTVVTEASALGVGGVVCFASGFGELHTDESTSLTEKLVDAAGEMPILGPNCYGWINLLDRVSLFPDQVPEPFLNETGVFIASQSGTIVCNLSFMDRSLPMGYLISIGNQAQISAADLIDGALEDPRVTAIGLYLEAVPDVQAFAAAVLRAREKAVPVVVFLSGRSATARRIIHSHTGRLGGADKYIDALFRQLGVARVQSLSEFVETLKLMHFHGPLADNTLMLGSPSGGELAMASDMLVDHPIELPPIPETLQLELKSVLGERVTTSNPLDFQTHTWHQPAAMQAVFSAYQRVPAAASALVLDHPDPDVFDAGLFIDASQAFVDAAVENGEKGSKAILMSNIAGSLPRSVREMAARAGVAPLMGMHDAFLSLGHAMTVGQAWQTAHTPSLKCAALGGSSKSLSEVEAKRYLAKHGFGVPKSVEVPPALAPMAADKIGYPVVLKASGADLSHKTEMGGVRLNLRDHQAVADAAQALAALSEMVLVEEMVTDGVAELILGIDADPDVGPVLMIGAGGVLAELLEDTALLLPPVTPEMAAAALSSLKVSKLIDGWRGKPPGDRQVLVDTICALSRFAEEEADRLLELDINPLIVRPVGQGVAIADALICQKAEAPQD